VKRELVRSTFVELTRLKKPGEGKKNKGEWAGEQVYFRATFKLKTDSELLEKLESIWNQFTRTSRGGGSGGSQKKNSS
jgi:hypothetical protein